MSGEDGSKTREQLLEEVEDLRAQLERIRQGPDPSQEGDCETDQTQYYGEGLGDTSSEIIWDIPGIEESSSEGQETQTGAAEVLWLEGSELDTGSPGKGGWEDLTHSGSFDLRWMRWAAFARLLQAIPMSMMLLDQKGDIHFANQNFIDLVGPQRRLGQESFLSFFPTNQKAREAEDLLGAVLAKRDHRTLESPLRIGTKKVWAKLNFRPIRFGSDRQILVVLEDLTSKMNELALNLKYRRLVRSLPIGIVELSLKSPINPQMSLETLTNKILDARITEGNIEFARIHGYRNERELSGLPLGDLLPWGPKFRNLISRWVEMGLTTATTESKEKDANNEIRSFETTLLGLVREGWVTEFWGMRQDITERKRTEEDLVEKIRTIDNLYEHILQSGKSRVIADHTAGVAHELRQPLAIIGGLARRLTRRLEGSPRDHHEDTLDSLAMMIAEVKRLEKILDGLIDFTRKESIRKRLVDPNELINYVLRINDANLLEKNLRVEARLDEAVGKTPLDPDRFQHIIRNLVANAIEASPMGGVIRISTRVSILSPKAQKTGDMPSERFFEMKVHNYGKPIPSDELKAIFDPFCTTKDRGAGIGLTLSKKIAEEHNGSISVASNEKGTQFTVWIPMD